MAQLAGQAFHPAQSALIESVLASAHAQSSNDPLGHPLSTVYLIARAHDRRADRQAEHTGAFCLLYLLALDLFDDVQDDDLAGTPLAETGAPIAINTAITLLFLSNDQLRLALELEADPERRMQYLQLLSHVSLQAVAGQHRDLMGEHGARSPEEVLQMQQAKTSSLVLLAECGALLGGCDAEQRARYRTLGEQMSRFIQVRDDLRDIFGKTISPDLMTGKNSYPVACFLNAASAQEERRFRQLLGGLPETLSELRTLLYDAGAVLQAATTLQQSREQIHRQAVAIDAQAAPLRLLLDIVDALAEDVYQPPPIAESASMWRPHGRWHEQMRREQERFVARTSALGLPAPPPQLRPWHQPHWLYLPAKRVIYYPDIEGLRDEALPFHAELLSAAGHDPIDEVAELLHGQLAAIVAHEMFHFWRDTWGLISDDYWHEEWVANTLAVAYCAHFEPAILEHSAAYAKRLLAAHPEAMDERIETLLSRCAEPHPEADNAPMGLLPMAVATSAMLVRIIDRPAPWPDQLHALLPGPAAPQPDPTAAVNP